MSPVIRNTILYQQNVSTRVRVHLYKWRIRCVAPPKWKGFFSGAVSVPGLANGARALHDWAGPLGITISRSISISATVTVPGVPTCDICG